MMRCFFISLLLFFSTLSLAQETIVLEKVAVDANDIGSITRGAKFFAANCQACHTLMYLRYDKVAKNAGITSEKVPVNVTSFGVKPPDLSLEADVHGADWIYTYLHSFYQDVTRPTGLNNLILSNSAMPGILVAYQGPQVLAQDIKLTQRIYDHNLHWYDVLELQAQGSMTPAEFDATVTDVVNFLVYAAEPYQAQQHRLGWWVLGFLGILFIFLYLLKQEYWKDISPLK